MKKIRPRKVHRKSTADPVIDLDNDLERVMREWRNKLLHDAKSLQIPVGAAEMTAKKVTKAAEKWLKAQEKPTEKQLREFITKEVEKYHADLAYVCKNHGKII